MTLIIQYKEDQGDNNFHVVYRDVVESDISGGILNFFTVREGRLSVKLKDLVRVELREFGINSKG